ncbi:MAG: flagellar biosynthesis anti-sigma factor FlgM [Gammaproteobacteria bacterium]|nr:flagellar biosynthesis anti-sigma factor FlgM [Gammaproteobacteria bacterium]
MVAEINGAGTVKPLPGRATSATRSNQPAAAKGPAAGKTSGDNHNVTLTDLATRLQVLAKSIEHLPEVDQARVAQFRQALADGDYNPPALEIAEKLEAFERELAAREPGA